MYKEIAANKRKTFIMMVLFIIFVGLFSWIFALYLGEPKITYGVILCSLVYVAIVYYNGSKMALALNSAKQIEKKDNPRLYRIVENLSITDGLPMPKVYIIEDPAPNAFATGKDPNHSAVCATSGLLEIMNDTELEGVFAHEMGHVKNYDIRVSMMAFALVAIISIIADMILRMVWFRDDDEDNQAFFILGIIAAILAPIVALMIQMAISRKREYLADATGALTTRYPEGLADALEKISQSGSVLKKQNASTAHLFFANPLKAKGLSNLFSTHPPIEDRIKKLRGMDLT